MPPSTRGALGDSGGAEATSSDSSATDAARMRMMLLASAEMAIDARTLEPMASADYVAFIDPTLSSAALPQMFAALLHGVDSKLQD